MFLHDTISHKVSIAKNKTAIYEQWRYTHWKGMKNKYDRDCNCDRIDRSRNLDSWFLRQVKARLSYSQAVKGGGAASVAAHDRRQILIRSRWFGASMIWAAAACCMNWSSCILLCTGRNLTQDMVKTGRHAKIVEEDNMGCNRKFILVANYHRWDSFMENCMTRDILFLISIAVAIFVPLRVAIRTQSS